MRKEQFPEQKLLVEGTSDLFAIAEIRNRANITDNFDIIDTGNIINLKAQISPRLNSSEIKTLGIVVDADENISKIWNEIKKIFQEKNITLPKDIDKNGLIHQTEDIKIGIWIMPNNNLNGILEDFITYLVPKEDKLMPKIEIHIQNIETENLHKYNSNNQSKAKIHSWLAMQESPGTPIGKAINYKYFSVENPECENFIN